jgi:hypothetical protein
MSGTGYDTIADNVSREIRTASKKNLICGRFSADCTRTLRHSATLEEFGKRAEFRLPPDGWPFFK